MKYKIQLSYQTGDSFRNHNETDCIELEWDNLEIAKENLKRIEEHYLQHRAIHDYFNKKTDQEIFAENANKSWFVAETKPAAFKDGKFERVIDAKNYQLWIDKGFSIGEIYADYYAENCLKLKADNGNEMQMSAFWIGHFESLHEAEIIIDNSDMKFTV